eukprot:6426141-Amphidinium_carterae.1
MSDAAFQVNAAAAWFTPEQSVVLETAVRGSRGNKMLSGKYKDSNVWFVIFGACCGALSEKLTEEM